MRGCAQLLSTALLSFAAAFPLSASAQQAALPNGASSLQEAYQDWQLTCALQNNAPACVVSQDQVQQNGQRLLTVEVATQPDGGVATVLLPFGILFDGGVTPQIDDQAPMQPLRFKTCLPGGCIVTFPLDQATLEKLRSGTALKLTVTTAANTSLTFPISLKGLTAALDRLSAIKGG